jgi:hypothetical protein
MINFKKTTPTCSNIYLIDENVCLAKSINTLNYNFSSLSISLDSLSSYRNSWYELYTTVSTNSSNWIKTATNIKAYSAVWLDTALTVSSLSSTWTKPYTIYYPKMMNIDYWYSLSTINKNSLITNWMNTNFKYTNINTNILVDIVVYLIQNQQFSFRFNRSFNETCTPNGGGVSIGCSACGRPNRGCNHHGGAAGVGPCTNAYDACRVTTTSARASVACVGTGGKSLNIGLSRNATDANVARTIRINTKNVNGVWSVI